MRKCVSLLTYSNHLFLIYLIKIVLKTKQSDSRFRAILVGAEMQTYRQFSQSRVGRPPGRINLSRGELRPRTGSLDCRSVPPRPAASEIGLVTVQLKYTRLTHYKIYYSKNHLAILPYCQDCRGEFCRRRLTEVTISRPVNSIIRSVNRYIYPYITY